MKKVFLVFLLLGIKLFSGDLGLKTDGGWRKINDLKGSIVPYCAAVTPPLGGIILGTIENTQYNPSDKGMPGSQFKNCSVYFVPDAPLIVRSAPLIKAAKAAMGKYDNASFVHEKVRFEAQCVGGSLAPEYQIGNSIASFDNPNFNGMPGGADRCYVCKDKCLTNSELSGKITRQLS